MGQKNETYIPPFKHKPLDIGKPSIRLIRLTKKNLSNGIIRCTMCHMRMPFTAYTCLSYRWGDDVPQKRILIDGKEMLVRQNLFDFLRAASKRQERQKMTRKTKGGTRRDEERWFWIDALCIDQNNVLERNHRVQHMGIIYQNASRVFLWLGKASDVGTLSNYLNLATETRNAALDPSFPMDIDSFSDVVIDSSFDGLFVYLTKSQGRYHQPNQRWLRGMKSQDRRMEKHLYDNEYWHRAWVTQEILHAKSVLVLVNDEAIAIQTMIDHAMALGSRHLGNVVFLPFAMDLTRAVNGSLIALLVRFKNRKCSIPRDRLFSLISICGYGKTLKVYYRISSEELLVEVLRHCEHQQCLCTAAAIAYSLDLHLKIETDTRTLAYHPPFMIQDYYLDFDIHAYRTGRNYWCALLSDTYLPGPYDPMSAIAVTIADPEDPVGLIHRVLSPNSRPICRCFTFHWRQPSTSEEECTVWLQSSDSYAPGKLEALCSYSDGFEICAKDAPYVSAAESTGTQCRYTPEKELSDNVHDTCPQFWQHRSDRDDNKLSNEEFHALEVLTVRVSFGVLAKLAQNEIRLCGGRGRFSIGIGENILLET